MSGERGQVDWGELWLVMNVIAIMLMLNEREEGERVGWLVGRRRWKVRGLKRGVVGDRKDKGNIDQKIWGRGERNVKELKESWRGARV